MKIAVTISRILLGLLFVFAGVSGFLILNHPPAMPGIAGQFQTIFFASRWVLVTDTAQALAGLLLLVNRYVGFALLVLAAVFVNILTFHLTMMPSTIAPALVAVALWVVCAWPFRAEFARVFGLRYGL